MDDEDDDDDDDDDDNDDDVDDDADDCHGLIQPMVDGLLTRLIMGDGLMDDGFVTV